MFVDRSHSCNASVTTSNDISDSHGFLDSRACSSCAIEKNGVERRAPDSKTAVTVSAESVTGSKLAVNGRSVGCVNAHPGELCGSRGFDRLARIHLCENTRCLRAQVLGACLVPRESRAIENDGVDSQSRKKKRSGRAGWSAADDYCLRVRHARGRDAGRSPCTANVVSAGASVTLHA